MLAKTVLSEMSVLRLQDFEAAFGAHPFLVLAPHPDDESLGCGGAIAEACRRGNPPVVVVLTDGSKSHPNSLAFPSESLRALREAETREAIGKLGLGQERLVFLRYPDSQAPRKDAPVAAAGDELAALITQRACRTVVTSWLHDPHCDHEAAWLIAAAACRLTRARLLAYPVWGLTLPPDADIDTAPIKGFRFAMSRHLAAKRAAIECHRSQYAGIITDDPEGFQMSPDFMARFLKPTETYLEMDARR